MAIVDSDPTGTYDLPQFSEPSGSLPPWMSDGSPSSQTSPSSPEASGSQSDPSKPTSTKPATPGDDTRTGTSSRRSGGDPVAAGKLVAGILGLVAGVTAGLLRRRGRELRMPTKTQLRDVGDPVGRMLVRHADLSLLGPDLGDFIEAGSATGNYLTEDRLTKPLPADPGYVGDPDNYNQEY